jgi:glycosyltransferase involved in cell wall biosynthesis
MTNYPISTDLEGSSRFRVHVVSLHADPATAAGAAGGGGTHSYLRELLTALPRRGRSITVITRRTTPLLAEHQPLSRFAEVRRVQIGTLAPVDKRLLDSMHALSVDAVRSAILAGGAPVPVLHSVYWNSGRVAMELSRELGIRFVHTVISNGRRRTHAGAEENGARRIEVEQEVFDAAFRIFCICPAERDDLVELYGVDSTKIVVVGRPVSVEFLVPPHDELGNPQLLPPWNEMDPVPCATIDTGAG